MMPAYKSADEAVHYLRDLCEQSKPRSFAHVWRLIDMSAQLRRKGSELSDYNLLTTVTVKDGLLVGASSFNGCSALTTINGADPIP